ncbi:MAG: hypothetical protein M3Y80_06135, partial [Verrucomicrobiota bacterium]|nr:hypothetical protein [Verrucomicrobiota bacterium]
LPRVPQARGYSSSGSCSVGYTHPGCYAILSLGRSLAYRAAVATSLWDVRVVLPLRIPLPRVPQARGYSRGYSSS